MNREALLPRHAHRYRTSITLLLLGASALLALSSIAVAQERTLIGPGMGYSFGIPLTIEREPGRINRYGADRTGESYEHAAWFGVTALTEWPRDRFALSAELALALFTGGFTSDPFSDESRFDPITGFTPRYRFEISSTLSVLQLGTQAHFGLDDQLMVGVGPWLSYRLSSGFHQIEYLLNSDSLGIDSSEARRVIAAGEELGSSRLRFGLLLSGAYRIPLDEGMELHPRLDLRVDGAALAEGFGERAMRVGAGLTLLFDLARTTPPLPPPVDTPVVIAERPPLLSTSIDLFSGTNEAQRSAVARVRPQRTLYRQSAPLPPVIFFDAGSATIPSRYVQLSPADATSFSNRSLARLDPLAAYRQLLNVLGLRMRSESGSRIRVIGATSPEEPEELARERASVVRRYLTDVWGIEEGRIDVQTAGTGAGDTDPRRLPSVSITSPSSSLLAPLVTEWMVRELHAQPFGLSRSVAAESGVRGWTLAITQGPKEIARYSGENLSTLKELTPAIRATAASDERGLLPLVAELRVEDSTGQTAVVSDTLALAWDTSIDVEDAAVQGPAHREVVTTLLLDAGSGWREARGDGTIRAIAEQTRDGAQITLTRLGDSDRSGESTHIQADALAAALLDAVRERGTRIAELHVTARAAAPYDRAAVTPEEEILTDGVRIVLEQDGPAARRR